MRDIQYKNIGTYCVNCKERTVNKILVLKDLGKIDYCLQIVLFALRKNQGSLKIKRLID